MRKTLRYLLQYVIFLGLGILLLWLTTRNLTRDEIAHLKYTLRHANYFLLIPVMVMLLLSHYSRALRWKILMEPLNFYPSSLNTFFAVMISYFFNLLVPRLGEVMKCTVLARYEKAPLDKLIGTMVAERAFDFICLLFVMALTVALQVNVVGEFAGRELKKLFLYEDGSLKTQKLLILAFLIIFFILLQAILFRKFSHLKWVKKLEKVVKGMWMGLNSVRHLKHRTAFLLHTLFIWTMYLLSIRIGFYAMEPVSHLGMRPSFSILSFGSIAMIVTQGGIGAYQLAIQKVLTLYDIRQVDGLAYGWLLWTVQTVMVILIGLISLLLLPVINRKK